jgi:hypothetical protein
MLPRRPRPPALDAVCAAAIDFARQAAEDLGKAENVGDHLGVAAEGDRLVTHFFACLDRAYVGWQWAVTVARAPRARHVTLDESVLLPTPDALLAPEWLPWSQRLRPGDLGVGDLLPTREDDPRLEPGWLGDDVPDDALAADDDDAPAADAADAAALVRDFDLGRARVLSPIGRDDAVDRWHEGDRGPRTPLAEAAPAQCSTCGFLWGMRGSLGRIFGVCTNEYAPDDGRVVSVDHGCGAHSEAAVMPTSPKVAAPRVDEMGYDFIARAAVAHQPGSVDGLAPAEDLGHS